MVFRNCRPRGGSPGRSTACRDVYRHAKCGVATEMPEDVVRSYLADPWLYNDWVWCCGCEDNIRQQDLVWADTGESLSDYFGKLKRRKVAAGLDIFADS